MPFENENTRRSSHIYNSAKKLDQKTVAIKSSNSKISSGPEDDTSKSYIIIEAKVPAIGDPSVVTNQKMVIGWKDNYFSEIENIHQPRGPKFKCTECLEVFNTKLSLLTHSKIHLKPFCIACNTYKDTKFLMAMHMKNDHPALIKCVTMRSPVELKTFVNSNVISKQESQRKSNASGVFNGPGVNKFKRNVCKVSPLLAETVNIIPQKSQLATEATDDIDPLRTIEAIKAGPPENVTKTFVSRFGRCITIRMPDF